MNEPTVINVACKEKKVWGETRSLFADNNVQVHYLEIEPFSVCSRHNHKFRNNRFVNLGPGKLMVRVYREKGYEDTILLKNEVMDVAPGIDHRFISLNRPTKALEIYFLNSIDGKDIIRNDLGRKYEKEFKENN